MKQICKYCDYEWVSRKGNDEPCECPRCKRRLDIEYKRQKNE